MAAPWQLYRESKFITFEDTEEELTEIEQLQNRIHPIFHPDHFSGGLDWAVLAPSLRLASRLLLSPAAIIFWNILINPQLTTVQSFHGIPRLQLSPHDGQDSINEETKANAKLTLENVANLIQFSIEDLPGGLEGETSRVPARLARRGVKWFPRGCRSLIKVSSTLVYEPLKKATDEHHDSSLPFLERRKNLLGRRVDFASTLLHELAHALINATDRHLSHEPYYRDDAWAEVGYALEDRLFGGMLVTKKLTGPEETHSRAWAGHRCPGRCVIAKLTELPSRRLDGLYLRPEDYGTRDRGFPRPPYDVVWRVPFSYHQSLFSERFWLEVERECSADALHVPREAAWVFMVNDQCGHVHVEVADTSSPALARERLRDMLRGN